VGICSLGWENGWDEGWDDGGEGKRARTEYVRAQEDPSAVKKELDRLGCSRKTEIDPDDRTAKHL